MVPARILRQVGNAARRVRPVAVRFQSTTATPVEKPEATPKEEAPPKKEPKRTNRKLREIRNQVSNTFGTADNLESREIFEEGVAYLREIQATEKIDDFDIYMNFELLGIRLLDKLIEANDDSIEQALEVLVTHKVAHSYHFFLVMKHNLETQNYQRNLALWVKYLEARTLIGHKVLVIFPHIKAVSPDFNSYLVRDLAFFSYYLGAVQGLYQFKTGDVKQLLQLKDMPFLGNIEKNIRKLELPTYKKELDQFVNRSIEFLNSDIHPNTKEYLARIERVSAKGDTTALISLYEEAKAVENLSFATLYSFMTAFYDQQKFEYVFECFGSLLASGAKISNSVWSLVIKSMGHSNYVEGLGEEKRKELVKNIERLISTMEDKGVVMEARTLASIIGAFSNLNKFDKVDQYLAKYSDLPLITPTKNNILNGLIVNGNIGDAEERMTQYIKADRNYRPSIMVLNNFLSYYTKNKNHDAVNGIVKYMHDNQIEETIVTLTILTDYYFKVNKDSGKQAKVDQLFDLFKKSGIQTNYHTYAVWIDGLIKNHNIEAARVVFKQLDKTVLKKSHSPQILTTMIKGELESGSIEQAELLFDKYITAYKNETRIWNTMISELLSKNERLALQYYANLRRQRINGVVPNFFTFYFLIAHFLRRNNKEVVNALIGDLSRSGLSSYGRELPKILRSIDGEYVLPQTVRAHM